MRGLLYKEMLSYKIEAIIILWVELMLTVVYISMPVIGIEGEELVMLATLCHWISFAIVGLLNCEVFRHDERKAWTSFAMSLPQATKGVVQSKYYMVLIVNTIMLFLVFLMDCILVGFSGDIAVSTLLVAMMIYCWRMFLSAVEIPFILRFGYMSGMWVKGVVLGIVLGSVVVYGLFGDISFFLEGNVLEKIKTLFVEGNAIWILAWIPYLTVGIYYLSYRISLKLYQKGAENYEQ